MSGRLLILGGGGHGRVVADAALECGYQEIAFLDDTLEPDDTPYGPVLGPTGLLSQLATTWPAAIAAVGNNRIRQDLVRRIISEGFAPATIVHPSAVISRGATVAAGSFVAPGAVVATGSRIGEATIINTGATVDHDCNIGEACHIAPGATLSGSVTVGARAWLGTNCSIRNGVSIESDVVVGLGAAVVSDLLRGLTYAGVPARPLPRP